MTERTKKAEMGMGVTYDKATGQRDFNWSGRKAGIGVGATYDKTVRRKDFDWSGRKAEVRM